MDFLRFFGKKKTGGIESRATKRTRDLDFDQAKTLAGANSPSPVTETPGASELRLRKEWLEEKNAILEMVLETSRHGLLVTDVQGRVAFYNDFLVKLWDLDDGLFEGSPDEWKTELSQCLKDPSRIISFFDQVLNQTVQETLDIFDLKNGKLIECRSQLQFLEAYQQSYRVWSFHDCTEQQRRERELQHLSTHDTLTGIYNRSYFESVLRQCRMCAQMPLAMVMVDIDGLKKVNDYHGHPAGDDLLRQAGIILRQACRAEDVVARLGGDEFGILLMHADEQAAEQVVSRIHGLLNMHNIRHPDAVISLSLGTAVAKASCELEDLFDRADATMYNDRRVRRSSGTENSPK
jgi:diguanylate cyclase (GGDEF)-like protein